MSEDDKPFETDDVGGVAPWPFPREFVRARIRLRARLTAPGGRSIEGATRDLSIRGMFLECTDGFPVDTVCEVRLFLDGLPEGAGPLEAHGRIVRVEPLGLAVLFTEVQVESLEHLRYLVLYNTTNPDRALAEFESHLGLRRREAG
jgi:PilZ domain